MNFMWLFLQSSVVVTETLWPTKPKIFIVWSCTEKACWTSEWWGGTLSLRGLKTCVEFWCICFQSGACRQSLRLSKPQFLHLWNCVVMPILPSCHEYLIDNVFIIPPSFIFCGYLKLQRASLTNNHLPWVYVISFYSGQTKPLQNCPLLSFCQIIVKLFCYKSHTNWLLFLL